MVKVEAINWASGSTDEIGLDVDMVARRVMKMAGGGSENENGHTFILSGPTYQHLHVCHQSEGDSSHISLTNNALISANRIPFTSVE